MFFKYPNFHRHKCDRFGNVPESHYILMRKSIVVRGHACARVCSGYFASKTHCIPIQWMLVTCYKEGN